MSQQLMVLSAKYDDLDLILGTNVVEEKTDLLELFSNLHICVMACVNTHVYTHKNIKMNVNKIDFN